MSDLQVALLAIGGAIIVAVIAYNKWQERKYRRLDGSNFGISGAPEVPEEIESAARNVVATSPPDARIEPGLPDQDDGAVGAMVGGAVINSSSAIGQIDLRSSPIDWCGLLIFQELISGAKVIELAANIFANVGKTVRLEGFESDATGWLPLTHVAQVSYLRVSVQLCDRHGVIQREELGGFLGALSSLAGHLGGEVRHESIDVGMERAQEIDQFCAETDVQIGVNVVARSGKFDGKLLDFVALAIGGVSEPDGSYIYRDSRGVSVIRMSNLESPKFFKDAMPSLRTAGVTFEIDVPRTIGSPTLVDELFALATEFAGKVEGRVVDDNQRDLTPASRAGISSALEAIEGVMKARGIVPGEALALRLYS